MSPAPSIRVAVVLVVFSICGAQAQRVLDYPQWRGTTGDGSASSFTAPTKWPPVLRRQWTAEVGEGYGTPLVIGQTVYVFTRRGEEEVMTALDAATGRERWHTGYSAPYSPSQATAAHGAGPKATPLFLSGMLFTQGVGGVVSAFDVSSGRRVWHTSEPKEQPFYSAASSPTGEGGLVVVHPGNYEPLTAFDAKTGTVRWRVGAGGFFMSPLLVTLDDVRQVVTVSQTGVIGVSVPDGRLLWQYPWDGGGMGGSMPIVFEGMVIVGAGSGMKTFKPTRRGAAWAIEPRWETTDVSLYLSNPVVVGDALFGLSQRNRGQLFALDARTGKVLWLGRPREATNTAVVKSNDLLFLLHDDGRLIVARADRTAFQPIARYNLSESATWAQPAISGGRIFIKDVRSLSLWATD